ncbi:MAG TPA: hypothetical protein PKC12_01145 [Thiobacillaceae bacterium]|nr:hypothetical protein [Thiobacillaceae bacterium]
MARSLGARAPYADYRHDELSGTVSRRLAAMPGALSGKKTPVMHALEEVRRDGVAGDYFRQ